MFLLKFLYFELFFSCISAIDNSTTIEKSTLLSTSVVICKDPALNYESSGTLSSPYQPVSTSTYMCTSYLVAPLGYSIEIKLNSISQPSPNYVSFSTSTFMGLWENANITSSSVNNTVTLKNVVKIVYYYQQPPAVTFSLTWNFKPPFSLSFPKSSACRGPDILFLVETSQAILQSFWSNDIKSYIRNVTTHYLFTDDVTSENPFSSRFGVIQFSDQATVDIPLGEYKRVDFLMRVQNLTYRGGVSNLAGAISLANQQFTATNIYPFHMIVLILNDVSPFYFNVTQAALNRLKQIVQLPTGIIVPGLPGIPSGAHSRLAELLGNADYTFDSLQSAATGIPTLSDSTFKCPTCSNLIFICEMTEAIGWETKQKCLELSQRLAITATKNDDKKKYAIGLYGNAVYHNIKLQTFADFNLTITDMIRTLKFNNTPNGGRTAMAPILTQLFDTVNSNDNKYSVFMTGQLSVIRDLSATNTAAKKLGNSLNSDIYILDQTRYGENNLWSVLTKNQTNHIVNGADVTDIDKQFAAFNATLLKNANEC